MDERESSGASPARRRVLRLDPAEDDGALRHEYVYVNTPLFVGEGSLDYACSRCFLILGEGIAPGELRGAMIRCCCGALNRVPPAGA